MARHANYNRNPVISGGASRRALLSAASLLALGTTFSGPASAESPKWPDKPIRILVAAPAGGTSDALARLIGDGLSRSLGQPVVVENKPGGLGTIAMDAFLATPSDGYTFMVGVSSLVTEFPYSVKLRYDPFTAIKPLVRISNGGLVLVGNPALPPKNVAELVAYVKANPGRISFASYSAGTASHINGLQLNKAAGLDMQHVGYKGSPPALQDVLGGQVQFMFDGLSTSLPLIKSGKLRAYAVVGSKRAVQLPDVPTMVEAGYPSMTHAAWNGFWTLPDVPAAIQKRVRDEVIKTLSQPEVRARLEPTAMDVAPAALAMTPEQLTDANRKAYVLVGELLRSVNYKPE